MRCPGPKRRNKYLAPDVNEVPITFLSDLMAQIELSCHISHLSLINVFGWSGRLPLNTRAWPPLKRAKDPAGA